MILLRHRLGALQRWVRDCDAASQSDGSFGDTIVLRTLDAILRTTLTPATVNPAAEAMDEVPEFKDEGPVRRMPEYVLREGSGSDLFAEVQSGVLPRASTFLHTLGLDVDLVRLFSLQSLPKRLPFPLLIDFVSLGRPL